MAQRPPSDQAVQRPASAASTMRILGELTDEGVAAPAPAPTVITPQSAEPPLQVPTQQSPAPTQQSPAPTQQSPAPTQQSKDSEVPGGRATVDQCRSLAESVVSSLMGRLKAEAQRRGGRLSTDDLDSLSGEFDKRTDALEAAIKKSFEGYVRDRARTMQNDSRQFPFDRIVVHLFSHLFVKRERADLMHGALSRRVLPGFFVAIEKMLGEDVIEELQNRARRIIARYDDQVDSDSGWEEIYADAFTQALVLDSVVIMAGYFLDFAKRAEWFQNMVNGHLPPVDAVHGEGSEVVGWELFGEPCVDMLAAIFAPLLYTLSTEKGRQAIVDRYGIEVYDQTIAVARQIQAIEDARA